MALVADAGITQPCTVYIVALASRSFSVCDNITKYNILTRINPI